MSEDLQEYLDQLETVQTELLDDPDNAELATLRDELLELIQLLQDDTNADDDDQEEVVEDEESEKEDIDDVSDIKSPVPDTKPKLGVPRPPPSVPSVSPTPPPAPPAPPAVSYESRESPVTERPALQSQNALAPKKKKSKWEKQEEALNDTKNKWQKFSQKANGGRSSMFQSPSDSTSKGEYYGIMEVMVSGLLGVDAAKRVSTASEKPFNPKRLRCTRASAARVTVAKQVCWLQQPFIVSRTCCHPPYMRFPVFVAGMQPRCSPLGGVEKGVKCQHSIADLGIER